MLGAAADPGLSPTLAVPGRLLPGDLTAALENALPNAVLRLAPGDYVVTGPLARRHPLTVIGAGPGLTRVTFLVPAGRPAWHLHVAEGHAIALSDLAIALPPGAAPSELLLLTAGHLRLTRCRLEGNGSAGHGLSVRGEARLDAEACALSHGGGYGLFVADRAVVTGDRLTLQGNGRGGVAVEAAAALTLTASRVAGNGRRGVLVRTTGECRLEANTITHNAGPGVEVVASPGLALDANRICGNRGAGLMLGEGSRATASANACEENSEDGIAVYKGARVRLVGNGAHRNGRFGVCVGSGGEAALDDNAAGDNQGGAFMAAHSAVLDGPSVVTAFRRRSDRSPRPTPEQARYGQFRGRR